MGRLLSYKGRVKELKQRSYDPQRQEYLLSIPFKKNVAKLQFTAFLEKKPYIRNQVFTFFFNPMSFLKNYNYLTREQQGVFR